jgi:plasmid stabilization system protein ParE
MQRPTVRFNKSAIKDFRQARDWYATRSQDAATNFVTAVDAAVDRIIEQGESLPIVSGRFRSVQLEKYPHSLVFYQRASGDIRIVAVAHPSRRPGYWRRSTQ